MDARTEEMGFHPAPGFSFFFFLHEHTVDGSVITHISQHLSVCGLNTFQTGPGSKHTAEPLIYKRGRSSPSIMHQEQTTAKE